MQCYATQPAPAMQSAHFSGDFMPQTAGHLFEQHATSGNCVLSSSQVTVRNVQDVWISQSPSLAIGQSGNVVDNGLDVDLNLWSRDFSLIRDSSLLREPSYLKAEHVADDAVENMHSWSSANTVVAGDNADSQRGMARWTLFDDTTWQTNSVPQISMSTPAEHDAFVVHNTGTHFESLQSVLAHDHSHSMPTSRCMQKPHGLLQTDGNMGMVSQQPKGMLPREPTVPFTNLSLSGGNGSFDQHATGVQIQPQTQEYKYNNTVHYNNTCQYNNTVQYSNCSFVQHRNSSFVLQPMVQKPMLQEAEINTKRAIEISDHCDATLPSKRQAFAIDREEAPRTDLRTPLLRCCKFTSKHTQEACGGELIIVPHKREHLACACPSRHQWVWCPHCCTCQTPEKDKRGCSVATHWFERDAFDTGARNHMNVHKQR